MNINIITLFPEIFLALNSGLLGQAIERKDIVINIINGNISKINDGEFNKETNSVKLSPTFSFLKNSNSLSKFKINTKLAITKKTKKRDLKKSREINFI